MMLDILFLLFISWSSIALVIFITLAIAQFVKKDNVKVIKHIKFACISAAVLFVSYMEFVRDIKSVETYKDNEKMEIEENYKSKGSKVVETSTRIIEKEKDTYLKTQEEEQKAKEAEEQVIAEQKVKDDVEKNAKVEKEITVSSSPKEITVSQAKEIIQYSGMGESDKLISLTVENGKIKAVIDLAPNEFNLSPKDVAVSTYSQASDAC